MLHPKRRIIADGVLPARAPLTCPFLCYNERTCCCSGWRDPRLVLSDKLLACYEQVITLHKQGKSQQAIAQQVGISLRTVQRWLAAGTFPERKPADAGQPT